MQDVKSMLDEIEAAAEKLVGRAMTAVAEFDAEKADPDETITISKIAQRLGFDLVRYDGSLVAGRAFNAIANEALFLNGYELVKKSRRK